MMIGNIAFAGNEKRVSTRRATMSDEETEVKLRRLSELHAVIERDGDDCDDADCDEYRTLKDEIIDEVNDVMNKLRKAGLLTVSLPITPELRDEVNKGELDSMTFDDCGNFVNGNIWLDLDPTVTGGTCVTPIKPPKQNGLPGETWADWDKSLAEGEAKMESEADEPPSDN
jgi:hypothetical protein